MMEETNTRLPFRKVTTYSALGRNGRLGNQMFQYATLLAKAKSHGFHFAIPETAFENGKRFRYELLDAFPNITASIISDSKMTSLIKGHAGIYREPGFSYDVNFELISPNVDIFGYFQSELYFSRFRNDLLKEFSFDDVTTNNCRERLQSVVDKLGSGGVCAVHIRRGDYLNLSHYHTNLGPEYYNSAIQHMIQHVDSNVKFLVFSDDITWCKSFIEDRTRVTFSDANNHVEDLCTMSLCDYHIIANSSFSWWGSWLSSSKCTVAPKSWFGPEGPDNWDTIYKQGWLLA